MALPLDKLGPADWPAATVVDADRPRADVAPTHHPVPAGDRPGTGDPVPARGAVPPARGMSEVV